MNTDRKFGGLIWTNHALERLSQRGIKQGDAWATWSRPDQSRKGASGDSWVYYRTWGDERIEVVTKKNERGETLVLSVWSKKTYGKPKESFLRFLLRKYLHF